MVAVGRRHLLLRELQKELGDLVHPLILDVRDRRQVFETIERLPHGFAEVDLLVNNAGLALGMEPAQNANVDDWNEMIDINCKGLTYCTRAILPGMLRRNGGHIINMGSIAADFPYPGGNVYGATKAFVQQFSLNLRADLLGTPIRITALEPGLCGGTEFSLVRFRGDSSRASAVYENIRALTAEDIAEAVYWTATLPPHMNVNRMQLMPVQQAFGPLAIDRSLTLP